MMERRAEFLDGCRGFAALYVAAGHIVESHLSPLPSWLYLAIRFGQEAVIIFFILSGYVIQLSIQEGKPQSARRFLWRRFLRLYPLLVLSLAVTYATTCLGHHAIVSPQFGDAVGHLFALQDFASVKPGVIIPTYLGNAPLWSLSYECWFYALFAVLHWHMSPVWRRVIVTALCVTGGVMLSIAPGAVAYWASYFAIWWTGRCLALAPAAVHRGERRWAILLLGIVTVLAGMAVFHGIERHIASSMGTYPWLMLRHLSVGFMMALAVAYSPAWLERFALRLALPFVPIAAWSYGLYVLHAPLSANLRWLPFALPPWEALVVYGAFGLCVSWWAERKYHPAVRSRLERLWQGPAALRQR